MNIRVHSLLESSTVNGPGKRFVLWTQGCTLGCPGCWNPETHGMQGGREETVESLLAWMRLVSHDGGYNGLTISGGEPMQQQGALAYLLRRFKYIFPELSVGMFSGYTEGECEKHNSWPQIKKHLDWAVLGRYNRQQPVSLPSRMISSANQRLLLFTKRYSESDFSPLEVEMTFDEQGMITTTGFPILGNI
jgi:anaerobic ribonucleoside-triphosphate reductase activating protein